VTIFKEDVPWWAVGIFAVLLAAVVIMIVWGIFFSA